MPFTKIYHKNNILAITLFMNHIQYIGLKRYKFDYQYYSIFYTIQSFNNIYFLKNVNFFAFITISKSSFFFQNKIIVLPQ